MAMTAEMKGIEDGPEDAFASDDRRKRTRRPKKSALIRLVRLRIRTER